LRLLNIQDLDALSLGSVFLATGGGGDPWVSLMLAKQAINQHGPVRLASVDDLNEGDRIVAVGGVGAPTVSLELLPSLDDPAKAIKAYENLLKVEVDAVISFEIGGGNSLVPILAAAALDIPIVDGDGMGRALPEAQMMTFAIADIPPTPALALDYLGRIELFRNIAIEDYEPIIRRWAHEHGGMITTVEHPMVKKDLSKAMVPGSLSFAIEVGKAILRNEGKLQSLLLELENLFEDSIYGRLVHLFTGKINAFERRIEGGYDLGRVSIHTLEPGHKSCAELLIKNEFIQVSIDEQVIATVPDLIVALDLESAQPLNAERLAYGQRIVLLGIGAPPHYRTQRALDVVGPSCFGLAATYSPI